MKNIFLCKHHARRISARRFRKGSDISYYIRRFVAISAWRTLSVVSLSDERQCVEYNDFYGSIHHRLYTFRNRCINSFPSAGDASNAFAMDFHTAAYVEWCVVPVIGHTALLTMARCCISQLIWHARICKITDNGCVVARYFPRIKSIIATHSRIFHSRHPRHTQKTAIKMIKIFAGLKY